MKRKLILGIILIIALVITYFLGYARGFLTSAKQSQTIVFDEIKFQRNFLGTPITFSISDKNLATTPVWKNPQIRELPLSIDEAITISKNELPKYYSIDNWLLKSIEIHRLTDNDKWFYTIQWKTDNSQNPNQNVIEIPVLMSREAEKLTIKDKNK